MLMICNDHFESVLKQLMKARYLYC